ncbi:hypothetical protein H5162_06015 [Pseudoalteromonas sp. SR41-8]|uniref:hypothetical protein n=1 Tax=unclassified Pseudoalteromonas TaxID=194690 RepID=UPI0015FF82B4|nr:MULTISPECIES: hypothetical protein [unclassified Pseudoalteromonas]MBB1308995.1 hypothetical protein [Pseudoalteromonas sp. SR41-8]MBB1399259.1 hypothetical protein [Pseudoalteromonas sp. SG44-8]
MNSDKFFKWVWNLNGIILLVGVLIATALISVKLVTTVFNDNDVEPPALNLADDKNEEEKWRLGYPRRVGETDFYYIELESEKLTVEASIQAESEVRAMFSSKYKPTRSKNVMFINGKTNYANWLFDTTDQLITDISPLYLSEFDSQSKAAGIAYHVIKNDTNNDGLLSNEDKSIFALSKIDGSGYSEVLTGFDRILERAVNEQGNLFMLFIDNAEVFSMLVDLTTFKVIDKRQLPKVGGL